MTRRRQSGTESITQRELSEEAGVMEPTTFSALNAMEQLGYISRRQLPDNRKNVYVFLTSKGRQLKDKLVPLAEEVNTIAATGVPAEHIAATRQTLLAIIENLARDETASADPQHRIPSTREIASRVAAGGKRKSG